MRYRFTELEETLLSRRGITPGEWAAMSVEMVLAVIIPVFTYQRSVVKGYPKTPPYPDAVLRTLDREIQMFVLDRVDEWVAETDEEHQSLEHVRLVAREWLSDHQQHPDRVEARIQEMQCGTTVVEATRAQALTEFCYVSVGDDDDGDPRVFIAELRYPCIWQSDDAQYVAERLPDMSLLFYRRHESSGMWEVLPLSESAQGLASSLVSSVLERVSK